jgi:hypothetical protein
MEWAYDLSFLRGIFIDLRCTPNTIGKFILELFYGLIIIFLFWFSYLPRVGGLINSLWPKNVSHFSVWIKVKWASGWCYALMDERLHGFGFGLLESAKTMDSWSSWSFEGRFYIFVVCFLFSCVVCCLQVMSLFCSLHEMGGA